MNLQERLLQNEIKHLGQIIQTLSYELIVLQDFLKDEYGSKFESFRKRISKASKGSSGTQRFQSHRRSGNFSRSDAAKNGRGSVSQSDGKRESAEDVAVVGDNSEISMDDSFDESGNEHDNAMSDSDSETSVTLRDPLEIELNVERKGGRRRTRIWKFFDKIIHSDNKFTARCHLCQGLVSSRAVRMVEHRLKCKRKLHTSTMRDIKSDLKREHHKDKRMGKCTNNDNSDKEVSDDAEEGEESNISNDRDHNERFGSNSQDKGYKKCGRTLDTIWNYFDIVYHNSMKKARCTSCYQFISPKAVRLRQHKMSCKGACMTKSKDNEEKAS